MAFCMGEKSDRTLSGPPNPATGSVDGLIIGFQPIFISNTIAVYKNIVFGFRELHPCISSRTGAFVVLFVKRKIQAPFLINSLIKIFRCIGRTVINNNNLNLFTNTINNKIRILTLNLLNHNRLNKKTIEKENF